MEYRKTVRFQKNIMVFMDINHEHHIFYIEIHYLME